MGDKARFSLENHWPMCDGPDKWDKGDGAMAQSRFICVILGKSSSHGVVARQVNRLDAIAMRSFGDGCQSATGLTDAKQILQRYSQQAAKQNPDDPGVRNDQRLSLIHISEPTRPKR